MALASATAPGVAHADCQPSAASPCIDANALWLRPGAHDFVAVPAGEPIPAGAVALGMGAMLLLRPLVLTAPSPDPRGREVPLVQHAVDQHLRVAAGLGHGFELGAALATVLWQRGAGPSAITTQRGGALESTAVRDPRVGITRFFVPARTLRVSARAELGLPLGDSGAYASTRGFTLAPSVAAQLRSEPWAFSAALGARLRETTELGATRFGSELELALGARVRVLGPVSVSLEAFALPSLVAATSRRGRELDTHIRRLPAEWLAAFRLADAERSPIAFTFAAGSGLPLSSESRGGHTTHSYAPTSPAFRALIEVSYVPRPPSQELTRPVSSGVGKHRSGAHAPGSSEAPRDRARTEREPAGAREPRDALAPERNAL